MKRMFYALCGIFECVGGVSKLEAENMATAFVESLE
jgi:hypothetical protein